MLGNQHNAQATHHDFSDPAAHWVLEGTRSDHPRMNDIIMSMNLNYRSLLSALLTANWIRNVKDGTYLDVKNGRAADENAVITHIGNSGVSQKFEIFLGWQDYSG
jgi:hypothetical protein